jgi:hypothetical protein
MERAHFHYVTYIASAPEKVWNALIDGRMTKDLFANKTGSRRRPSGMHGKEASEGRCGAIGRAS